MSCRLRLRSLASTVRYRSIQLLGGDAHLAIVFPADVEVACAFFVAEFGALSFGGVDDRSVEFVGRVLGFLGVALIRLFLDGALFFALVRGREVPHHWKSPKWFHIDARVQEVISLSARTESQLNPANVILTHNAPCGGAMVATLRMCKVVALVCAVQTMAGESMRMAVAPSRTTMMRASRRLLVVRGGSECVVPAEKASVAVEDVAVAVESSPMQVSRPSLNAEFLEIMGPALLGLTIEPVASLVDTAFVGRLCGESALAGVGVASSVFNVLAKSCNFLQSATTSHVARAGMGNPEPGEFDSRMARVASAAVYVAAGAGATIALGLRGLGSTAVRALGVGDQVVAQAALDYLDARAWAAPAALGLMALQGAFRGARDSLSPVVALCVATLANVGLDALLVPSRGAYGAALATSLAQMTAFAVLVSQLVRRTAHTIVPRDMVGLAWPELADCGLIARSGSVLALRTLSGVFAMQYASVIAARLGAAPGAAHVVAFQIWLAASLLADAVAVAVQALLAPALANRDADRATAIVGRAAFFAAVTAAANAVLLSRGGPALRRVFTKDAAALAHAERIWPIVVRSQAYSCGAFVCDGMLFAAVDFSFCALAMIAASLVSLAVQLGLANRLGLKGVWLGLETIMVLRFLTGAARVASGTGPWKGVFRGAGGGEAAEEEAAEEEAAEGDAGQEPGTLRDS